MHIHELNPRKTIIALLIFTAIIVVGLVTFKPPRLVYKQSVQQSVLMIDNEEGIFYPYDLEDVVSGKNDTVLLLDIRNKFDYARGNIKGSENISSVELLNEENTERLENLKEKGICVVLYADNQLDANAPWMVLRSLGFDNVKYLPGGYSYYKEWADDIADTYGDDGWMKGYPAVDYKEFAKSDNVDVDDQQSKSSINVVRKKKKAVAEGGC